ncbi:translocation and assembly module lipoprotein TamL [Prevotella pallens]
MKRNNKHNHSHFIAARGSLFCTAIVVLFVLTAMLSACSTTSALPEGEQLYTGMTPTEYTNYTKNAHFNAVQEELDIVLATKPNASLFGSPSLKSPFPVGLWIWNAFSPDTTKFGRWITRVFGSRPITLSNVSPDLHATVGKNLLNKRGYFNNKITHELVPQSNKKKIKLKYTVNMGHLWTIDSLQYVDFPPDADSLIQASRPNAIIKNGDAFDVATLEQERQRLTSLFRNNGYYYYKNNDASYLADTTIVRGKVITRLQLADSINPIDLKQWRIGKITVNLQKNFMEELRQHRKKQGFDLNFNGRHSPLRSRVIANDLQFRPGDLSQQSKHTETMERLNATRLFTASNISFKPSNSTDTCSTLNVTLDFMFDRPYDFYVEAYGRGKTTGKYGPELVVGVTKRNAFRGAELLNVRLHGAYEWTTKRSNDAGTTGRINDYQYGAEVSLQFPRFLNPFKTPPRILRERLRKREAAAIAAGKPLTLKPQRTYFESPMTTLSASTNVIKRALYFKRHVVAGELTYSWAPSERHSFIFKPLSLAYEYMRSVTDRFKALTDSVPYLEVSMADQFIPKALFQYTYQSPSGYANPIRWWSTVSEASNVIALGYLASGEKWNKREKTMFKNPFAQFVKIETNFTKLWALSGKSSIAAHANAGVVWAYGNSRFAPYSEQFFVGGANSIRAFNVREIGPGTYRSASLVRSYVEQTGEVKVQANVEYRPHLVGNLYGALFLDAGNVWTLHSDASRPGSQFHFNNFFKELAFGTGVGLRYDLGFFMLRVDWGIGLHVPYETGLNRLYNIRHFGDAQALHLAIGMPF